MLYLAFVSLCVSLSVNKITQKAVDEGWWNFWMGAVCNEEELIRFWWCLRQAWGYSCVGGGVQSLECFMFCFLCLLAINTTLLGATEDRTNSAADHRMSSGLDRRDGISICLELCDRSAVVVVYQPLSLAYHFVVSSGRNLLSFLQF